VLYTIFDLFSSVERI